MTPEEKAERDAAKARLRPMVETIPVSVRHGGYNATVEWKQARAKAEKVLLKPTSSLTQIEAEINNMARWQ